MAVCHSPAPSYMLGLFYICLVCLIWAAASVMVQYLYADGSFQSPFFLTYMGSALLTLLLPLRVVRTGPKPVIPQVNNLEEATEGAETDDVSVTGYSVATPFQRMYDEDLQWTRMDHFWAAAKIAPVWFTANYCYNQALILTSISSAIVIASTSSVFAFILAVSTGDEAFSLIKVAGIVLGILGTCLTGLHDAQAQEPVVDDDEWEDPCDDICHRNALLGDLLAILVAAAFGTYAVQVRLYCPKNDKLYSMQLLLGYMGFVNVVVLAPIAAWHFIQLDITGGIVLFAVVRGLTDYVLSEYLFCKAVLLTSATVTSVGLGLTIPLAFAADLLLGQPDVLSFESISGACSIMLGFLLVNIGSNIKNEDEVDIIFRMSKPFSSTVELPETYGFHPSTSTIV